MQISSHTIYIPLHIYMPYPFFFVSFTMPKEREKTTVMDISFALCVIATRTRYM